MKTPRFAKDRARAQMRGVDKSMWPDPPMVPAVALRQCEAAQSVEQVRAIVGKYLTRKEDDGRC